MTDTPRRRSRGWIGIAALVGVLLIPTAVIAAGGSFTDDDTSVFEADIDWLAGAGVTLGCNPPTNDLFCPDDGVTRGQMAAFMRRLADNQVVDAGALAGQSADYYTAQAASESYDYFDSGNIALTADGTVIAETSLTVPNDGFAMLTSTAAMGNSTSAGSLYAMWMEVDDGTCEVASDAPLNAVAGSTVYHGEGDEDDFGLASSGLAQLAAGEHTFTLCGYHSTGDGDTFNANLTALYVPVATISIASASGASDGGPTD